MWNDINIPTFMKIGTDVQTILNGRNDGITERRDL
jgi:hypothetical protein